MADEIKRIEIVTNAEGERRELKRAFEWVQEQHRKEATSAHPAKATPKDERSASELRSMKSYVENIVKKYYVAPFRRFGAALGPLGAVATKAATTPPRQWFGNIKAFVAGWITGNLLEPLGLLGSIVGGTLIMFAAPLVSAALKAPFQIARAGARAGMAFGPVGAVVGGALGIAGGVAVAMLAIKFVLAPLFWLGTTLKLARLTFGWAQETADQQTRIIGRTRRTFPGLIGAEFEQAQGVMRTKLEVAGTLFGGAADAMMEGFNRRLAMSSRGFGGGGQKDVFRDLGLTQGSVRAYEEIVMGGQRMTLTDWLYLFIKKREDLEAKIQATPMGTAAREELGRRKGVLLDHALQLFGQKFSEMSGTLTTGDWEKLNENIEAASPLSHVANAAERTSSFNIALGSVKETFSQLKRGISGDVMPKLTDMMEYVRTWLVSTTQDGQSMGMKLRKLGSALAVHAWETLGELLKLVKPEDIRALIEPIKNFPVQDVTKIVDATVGFLGKLASGIIWLTEWIAWFINDINSWRRDVKKYGALRGTAVNVHDAIDKLMGWGAGASAKAFAGGKQAMIDAYRKVGYGAGGAAGGGGPVGGPAAGGARYGGLGGNVTGGGGLKITGGPESSVDPKSLYTTLVGRFRASKLNGFVPKDGARYGIVTGSAEEWARLGTALAGTESGYKANPAVEKNPRMAYKWGGSSINPQGPAGLYQFGKRDLAARGLGTDVTNTDAQITAMVRELEKSVKAGGIGVRDPSAPEGWRGAAEHFGPIRGISGKGYHKTFPGHFEKAGRIAASAGAIPIEAAGGGTAGGAGATEDWKDEGGKGAGAVVQSLGGKRKLGITGELKGILGGAAQASGISKVNVTSGGQLSTGIQGLTRTGGYRHDLDRGGIGAADLDLYVGSRKLDQRNPEDRAIMATFIKNAVARGATGVGAGPGYMGGGSKIHVGGGELKTWGAGGASVNAPQWLREAHAAGFELRKRRPAGGNLVIGGGIYEKRAPSIIEGLMLEHGLTLKQAGAVVGNLGKESLGFKSLQETKSLVKGKPGGYGYAQWTGERRKDYFNWCKAQRLDPASHEANMGFLSQELRTAKTTSGSNFLEALKKTETFEQASRLTHEHYLRPADSQKKYQDKYSARYGRVIKAWESEPERLQYGRVALAAHEKEQAGKTVAALEAAKNIPVSSKEILTAEVPKNVTDQGTAAGEAAVAALKEGIKELKIPVELPTREQTERHQEKMAA